MTDQKPAPAHAGPVEVEAPSGPMFWRIVAGESSAAVLIKDPSGRDVTHEVLAINIRMRPGCLVVADITVFATVDVDALVEEG